MKPLKHTFHLLLLLLVALLTAACQQPPAASTTVLSTFVAGRYAYTPSRLGVKVIDIDTPTEPEIVGEMSTAGQVVRTQVHNGLLYALKIAGWHPATGERVPSGVIIAGLDNPLRPEPITFLPSTYGAYEMLATDTHLFVSDWAETRVYDLSDPAADTRLTTIDSKHDSFIQTADGTVYGGWANCNFRSGGCSGGIRQMTLTAGERPDIATYEYDGFGVQALLLIGEQVYVFGYDFIIGQRDNLANLPPPQPDTPLVYGRPVALAGNTLVTANGHELHSYTLEDPSAPGERFAFEAAPAGTYFLEATQHDDFLFLVSEYGFHVINITHPDALYGAGYVALDG